MSNGYLLAAGPDLAAAREISVGFGLDVIDAASVRDTGGLVQALLGAANVGIVLSREASADPRFVALMRELGAQLKAPQLILVDQHAHTAFSFLPAQWPAMLLDDAKTRATRRRDSTPAAEPPPPPPPPPPSGGVLSDLLQGAITPDPNAPPPPQQAPPPPPPTGGVLSDLLQGAIKPDPNAPAPAPAQTPPPPPPPSSGGVLTDLLQGAIKPDPNAPPPAPAPHAPEPPTSEKPPAGNVLGDLLGGVMTPDPAPRASAPEPPAPAPEDPAPALECEESDASAFDSDSETFEGGRALAKREAAPHEDDPIAEEAAPSPSRAEGDATGDEAEFEPLDAAQSAPPAAASAPREAAPADATAFAPKKLRRGTPELVRVVIHQPSQLREVIKAAKHIDPTAQPAPQGLSIGDITLGANVGIALEVKGAACEGALQRRSWAGEPIDFAFPVEADDNAKQAVFLARVFVDDAQIGVLAFTRPISGPAKAPATLGEVRLTRHKRVFLSYSSADREIVSIIATAYEMAGVQHFWDRTALKSGEEWSPRLKKEIERADLFHLCWSKAAAQSEWVAKEAAHALKRKRSAKRPEITVQMLDGPPWAPHPPELDAINFDDFVRAAIVGYARGEG